MSAVIINYELTLKDGADPSTSTAVTNLNADRYSEIIPLERSFMGEIHIHWSGSPNGKMVFQVSNDHGSGDDAGVHRINNHNIVTNWITHTSTNINPSDDYYRIALSDIGARWGRIFWDSTSGTGTVTSARVNLKGY